MRPSRPFAAVVVLLLAAATVWAALAVPPPPDHRVSDYARALTPAERERLEQKLVERERGSSNQVVVAVFRSLEGESLEDFSIRLAQAWRIGQKGLDNGVIFLVFLDDRQMRIEVGYGLEPTLTDAVASSILRDVVAPRFREGRIADGIGAGLDAIDQAIAGTYKPAAHGERPRAPDAVSLILLLVVLAGIGMAVIPPLFFYRSARQQGWTGGRGGWGGPMVGGGWGGRRGGGVGGGGFGGGGFGGGGGSFGGGGASGRW